MAELPAAVYALLQARLARLSTVAQEVAGLAAVIGRAFGFDLLVQAGHGSEDDVVQALEELWARRIVQEAGQGAYDFSHDRLRDVAYAELSRRVGACSTVGWRRRWNRCMGRAWTPSAARLRTTSCAAGGKRTPCTTCAAGKLRAGRLAR
ncbi:MAG: hypothetical protein R2838_07885 [Caldilineaceae bacterium]